MWVGVRGCCGFRGGVPSSPLDALGHLSRSLGPEACDVCNWKPASSATQVAPSRASPTARPPDGAPRGCPERHAVTLFDDMFLRLVV
eukprot:451416-Pyramimonas_sp.AAC.1